MKSTEEAARELIVMLGLPLNVGHKHQLMEWLTERDAAVLAEAAAEFYGCYIKFREGDGFGRDPFRLDGYLIVPLEEYVAVIKKNCRSINAMARARAPSPAQEDE